MRFIGVDLHSNQLTACYLTTSGQQSHRTFRLKDLAEFEKSLRRADRLAADFFHYKLLNTLPALAAREATKWLYLTTQNALERLTSHEAGSLSIGPAGADIF